MACHIGQVTGVGGRGESASPKVLIWLHSGHNSVKWGQNLWTPSRTLWKYEQNPWKYGKNDAQHAVIWNNWRPKWNEVFFGLEVTVLEFFIRASLGEFGQNPSHSQKFACSYTYGTSSPVLRTLTLYILLFCILDFRISSKGFWIEFPGSLWTQSKSLFYSIYFFFALKA